MNKTSMLKTFTLAFSLICAVNPIFASAKSDYWDGEEHHQHSSSQKDAASDLLKHIQLKGAQSILDIGCGDGKITASISTKLPDGKVLGADISPSMTEFAKKAFPKKTHKNLDFKLIAAEELDFDCQFDFVLSFTALQWVKDHQLIVKNVWKSLKPQGIFAVTMPMGLPLELKYAVDETVLEKKWTHYFNDFHTGWNFVQDSSYRDLLISEGFKVQKIQVVKQEDIFPSLVAFKGFISQWFPYLRPIPTHLKDEFMNTVLTKYIVLEPLDEQGRLHFKINRLEVVS